MKKNLSPNLIPSNTGHAPTNVTVVGWQEGLVLLLSDADADVDAEYDLTYIIDRLWK